MTTNRRYQTSSSSARTISIHRLQTNLKMMSNRWINIWWRLASFARCSTVRIPREIPHWKCFVDILHAMVVSIHLFLCLVRNYQNHWNVYNVWRLSNVGSIRKETLSLEANIAESKINWVKFEFQTQQWKYQMNWLCDLCQRMLSFWDTSTKPNRKNSITILHT